MNKVVYIYGLFRKTIFWLKLLTANEYNKSKIYSKYLGVKMGKNVRIPHFPRFGSEPYLIEIGNDVVITRGVCFVNHDGGVNVFRKELPGLDVFKRINIGNNVFIGINSIIMPGVTIGNNVVIGAGSLVNKNIEDNVVVAGIPARFIYTLPEYKNKILKNHIILDKISGDERKKRIINYLDYHK